MALQAFFGNAADTISQASSQFMDWRRRRIMNDPVYSRFAPSTWRQQPKSVPWNTIKNHIVTAVRNQQFDTHATRYLAQAKTGKEWRQRMKHLETIYKQWQRSGASNTTRLISNGGGTVPPSQPPSSGSFSTPPPIGPQLPLHSYCPRELKAHEVKDTQSVPTGSVSYGTTFVKFFLNGIPQGTDFNERVGDQVYLSSQWFNLTLYTEGTTYFNEQQAPSGSTYVGGGYSEIALILDRYPASSPTGISEIFKDGDLPLRINYANRHRFKMLLRQPQEWNMGIQGSPVSGTFFDKYIKFPKALNKGSIHPIYQATTPSDESDMRTGALLLYWVFQDDINNGYSNYVRCVARTRYIG